MQRRRDLRGAISYGGFLYYRDQNNPLIHRIFRHVNAQLGGNIIFENEGVRFQANIEVPHANNSVQNDAVEHGDNGVAGDFDVAGVVHVLDNEVQVIDNNEPPAENALPALAEAYLERITRKFSHHFVIFINLKYNIF